MKVFNKAIIVLLLLVMLANSIALISFADSNLTKEYFEGKRLGVITGSTQSDQIKNAFKNCQVFYFTTAPDCVVALKTNKVDGFVEDTANAKYLNSTVDGLNCIPCDGFSVFEEAYITPKNKKGEQLNKELNEFISNLSKTGELDRLISKWFDGTEEGRVMEVDYKSLPETNEKIVVATSPYGPPFEYIKDNEIVGFEIEILAYFCKENGYYPKFEVVDFSSALAGVSAQKFDIGACGFAITEERKKNVDFTLPLLSAGSSIVFVDDNQAQTGIFSDISGSINNTFVSQDRYKIFVSGALVSLKITAFSILFGSIAGFLIYCELRKGNRILKKIVNLFSSFVNGFPIVVFLMVLYYVIFAKSELSGDIVSIIGFSIIFTQSIIGILENGESAVDKGQLQAARALGYSEGKALFKIILPQSAQHFLPLLKSEVSSQLKATAVVGYITVVDITRAGDLIRGSTYDAVMPLVAVALFYFVSSFAFSKIIEYFEKKVDPKQRKNSEIFRGVTIL